MVKWIFTSRPLRSRQRGAEKLGNKHLLTDHPHRAASDGSQRVETVPFQPQHPTQTTGRPYPAGDPDVIARPSIVGGFSEDEISSFLRYYCSVCDFQEFFYLWRPWLKDPKDDMVLELAVAANCSYIVTHNSRDFKGIDQFGVRVISPSELLKLGDES